MAELLTIQPSSDGKSGISNSGESAELADENEFGSLREDQGNISLRQQVTLSWRNISLTTKKGKYILKDLYGQVRPGELTAIMGPSGAGKTTLLNVLAGFTKQKYTGAISVNGDERDLKVFRNSSCYVVQESNVFDYLTVRESVELAAALKISAQTDKKQKQIMAEKVIESLSLQEVQNTKAGKLSGGERKRLCIAQEIVSNPPLIFLDEPTSGLDSVSCLQCIKVLKSLAREGRTVVLTIHQPSGKIFEIFDQLYLMSEGQSVYHGPTQEMVRFFQDQGLQCPQYHNPADFALEVITGEYGEWNTVLIQAAAAIFKEGLSNSAVDYTTKTDGILNSTSVKIDANSSLNLLPEDSKNFTISFISMIPEISLGENRRDYTTGFFNQLRVLLYRNFICAVRNPMITHVQLGMYILTALFIGCMFYKIGNDAGKMHENAGLMFFVTCFNFFMVQTATVLTFPLERAVIAREHLNNWYSMKAYFIARSVTEIPYQTIFPMIFSSIVYWMTGQPPEIYRFVIFTVCTIMMYVVAQAFATIIGAIFDAQTATFIATGITVPVTVFCGFLVTFQTMPVYLRWLSYFSHARYIFQGVAFSLYAMDRSVMDCHSFLCMTPKQFMKYLDIQDSDVYLYFGVPILFIVLFKIIGYYVIRYETNRTIIR